MKTATRVVKSKSKSPKAKAKRHNPANKGVPVYTATVGGLGVALGIIGSLIFS